jgi:mannose-6-phosphate isomerase-like protein (cupin superfamily)
VTNPYTLKKLTDIADSAPSSGFGDIQEARFARDALDTELTGFSHHRIKPDRRQPFGHRHDKAEEVYVVLAGSGRAKFDEAVVELGTLDAVRVAPGVTRAFEAGPDGLELLVFGPRCDGDGEIVMGWWGD